MAVRIRLQRGGRKKRPYYQIVVADSRAPRDGRYIEIVGNYNPMTNPATINLDIDLAVTWLQKGAQPSDTVRNILSYKGALHKNHLINGANKGAFPMEEVETKFNAWLDDKSGKIDAVKEKLAESIAESEKAVFEAEKAANETRAKEIMAKNSPLAEEVEGSTDAEAAPGTTETEEATESVEAKVEETTETAEAPEKEESSEEKA